MNKKQKTLLIVDAYVNLILGVLLLLFPLGVMNWLGLPEVSHHFYTSIMGGVIFGIGLALLIEVYGSHHGISGIGIGGAIAINICGGGILLGWLILSSVDIPARGSIILWIVCLIVLGIGVTELLTKSWAGKEQ